MGPGCGDISDMAGFCGVVEHGDNGDGPLSTANAANDHIRVFPLVLDSSHQDRDHDLSGVCDVTHMLGLIGAS